MVGKEWYNSFQSPSMMRGNCFPPPDAMPLSRSLKSRNSFRGPGKKVQNTHMCTWEISIALGCSCVAGATAVLEKVHSFPAGYRILKNASKILKVTPRLSWRICLQLHRIATNRVSWHTKCEHQNTFHSSLICMKFLADIFPIL